LVATVSIRADVKAVRRDLSRLHKKEVPGAIKSTVNNLAFGLGGKRGSPGEYTKAIDKYLHRPTTYTKRAFKVSKQASPTSLTAIVEIQPDQWKYLQYQVEGGTASELKPSPDNVKVNAAGNIARTGLKRKGMFYKSFHGREGGVFKLVGGKKSKRMVAQAWWNTGRSYTKRFPFHRVGTEYVRKNFKGAFDEAMRHVLNKRR